MSQAVSLFEYRYKKYAKVSGEIDMRQDTVIIHSKRNSKSLEKQYIKQYLQLLSRKTLTN